MKKLIVLIGAASLLLGIAMNAEYALSDYGIQGRNFIKTVLAGISVTYSGDRDKFDKGEQKEKEIKPYTLHVIKWTYGGIGGNVSVNVSGGTSAEAGAGILKYAAGATVSTDWQAMLGFGASGNYSIVTKEEYDEVVEGTVWYCGPGTGKCQTYTVTITSTPSSSKS
jgi:hypothetical protein